VNGIVRNHWYWRPGWHPGTRFYTFHVTWRDQPAVQRLGEETRARLAGVPGLDPVPGEWLHLTMQGVGFAGEVSDADLARIADAAGLRLASVAPVNVVLPPPRAASEGAATYAAPAGVLDHVRSAVRAAIGDVWGADRVPESAEWAAHVSFAYASTDAPAAPVNRVLAGASGARATVQAVDLIRLGRDRRIYEWETVTRLPLGGSSPPRGC
jgi:hypothetical protein